MVRRWELLLGVKRGELEKAAGSELKFAYRKVTAWRLRGLTAHLHFICLISRINQPNSYHWVT